LNQADEGTTTAEGIPCGQHVLYTGDECGVVRAWHLQQCIEQLHMRAAAESALPRSKNNYNARRRLTRTGDERATDDAETDNINELNTDNLKFSEHHAATAAKHAKRLSSGVHDSHSAAKRSSSGGSTSSEQTAKQHAVAESHRAKRQSAPASNSHAHNGHESNVVDAMQQHKVAAQSLIANLQHKHVADDTSGSDVLQAERSLRAHTYSTSSTATANTNTGKATSSTVMLYQLLL
jgi:hypothetical protein